METILPQGETVTRTFLMPASLGRGGRAFIKGMALASARTWERIGDIDPQVVHARFRDADHLGEKVIHGIRDIAMSGLEADPRAVPSAPQGEEMLEVHVPVSAALDQAIADEILFTAERMGIQAARGMREDDEDPDLPAAGFWRLLFGPESDPTSFEIGRASAELGDQHTARFRALMLRRHDATSVPLASALMACANMAMTISVVANEAWPELAAAVRGCLEDEDLVPTRPAGADAHPLIIAKPAPGPSMPKVKPRETRRDDEWKELQASDRANRSKEMTPAAMVASHRAHIDAHRLIMLSDHPRDKALEGRWREYERSRESLYAAIGPLAPYDPEYDDANPLAEDALALLSGTDERVRDLVLRRSAELIDEPWRSCKYIPRDLARRHRDARLAVYALTSVEGYAVHVVARDTDIEHDGQRLQVWCTLDSKDAVEAEVRGWVHLHDWTLALVKPGTKRLVDNPRSVVAYASGTLLASHSSEAAFEACDMVSGMEVDFHKALHEKVLEPAGCAGLRDWAHHTEGEYAAIHLEDVRIAPAHRGTGLLARLIDRIQNVGFAGWNRVNATGGWAYVDELDRYYYGDEAEPDEELAHDMSQNEVSSYARAIVVPIVGTRRGADVVDGRMAILRRNSREGERATEVDPRIEARRVKLAAHFESVLATVTDDGATYDPWEYPVT